MAMQEVYMVSLASGVYTSNLVLPTAFSDDVHAEHVRKDMEEASCIPVHVEEKVDKVRWGCVLVYSSSG